MTTGTRHMGSRDGTGGPNGSSIQVNSGGLNKTNCEPHVLTPYFYLWMDGTTATNTDGMI